MFFALGPQKAFLYDLNPHLVETFCIVRDRVEDLIHLLDELPIEEKVYYSIRESRPTQPIDRAVRFIYLNKTCWNGLYRENKSGNFNVPFGLRDKQPSLVVTEPIKLRSASIRLQNVYIEAESFRSSTVTARAGDFVYFDPPYTVSHNENGFIEYNSSIFSWEDQQELSKLARKLRKRGCFVMISNANHQSIKSLYKDFKCIEIERSSTIANNKNNRKRITELVVINE